MPLKIEVKSTQHVLCARRQAAAQRVLDEFGKRLPDLRLLVFLDDEDWVLFRDKFGPANRGLYTPIKVNDFEWQLWPDYVTMCILADVQSSSVVSRHFDHVIYLYGSTCTDEVSLSMTLSHELQHFVQYGSNRKLWAENFLLTQMPWEIYEVERLNWPDIPNEKEARIIAKRTTTELYGADAVRKHIGHRIDDSITQNDLEDWKFSQSLDPSHPFDLAVETRRIFQRLKPYRDDIENVLANMRRDADFKNIDLSEYFDS